MQRLVGSRYLHRKGVQIAMEDYVHYRCMTGGGLMAGLMKRIVRNVPEPYKVGPRGAAARMLDGVGRSLVPDNVGKSRQGAPGECCVPNSLFNGSF